MSSADTTRKKRQKMARPATLVVPIYEPSCNKGGGKYSFPSSLIYSNLASLLGLTARPSSWADIGGTGQDDDDDDQVWNLNDENAVMIGHSTVELKTPYLREHMITRDMCFGYVELCSHGGHSEKAKQFLVKLAGPEELLDLYHSRCVTHRVRYFFEYVVMKNLRNNDFELFLNGQWSFTDKEGYSPTFASDDCKYVQLHDISDGPTLAHLRQRIQDSVLRRKEQWQDFQIDHYNLRKQTEIIRQGLLKVNIPLYNVPAAI